ncbi:MAG: hypothetical protein IJL14_00840 [Selenomonadaceae bacterium]|nr:hypothetical protein [Selenomonadaceae bacterium]
MNKYLVRLTYVGGVSNGHYWYYPVLAKTPEAAAKKARKHVERNFRKSMYVPVLAGVQTAPKVAELKADIKKFQHDIAEAELALNRAKNTLYDLKSMLDAVEEFNPCY